MADESGDESEVHWRKESWPWHDSAVTLADGVHSTLPNTSRAYLCDFPPTLGQRTSTDSRRGFSMDGFPGTPRGRLPLLGQRPKKDAVSQKKYVMGVTGVFLQDWAEEGFRSRLPHSKCWQRRTFACSVLKMHIMVAMSSLVCLDTKHSIDAQLPAVLLMPWAACCAAYVVQLIAVYKWTAIYNADGLVYESVARFVRTLCYIWLSMWTARSHVPSKLFVSAMQASICMTLPIAVDTVSSTLLFSERWVGDLACILALILPLSMGPDSMQSRTCWELAGQPLLPFINIFVMHNDDKCHVEIILMQMIAGLVVPSLLLFYCEWRKRTEYVRKCALENQQIVEAFRNMRDGWKAGVQGKL